MILPLTVTDTVRENLGQIADYPNKCQPGDILEYKDSE